MIDKESLFSSLLDAQKEEAIHECERLIRDCKRLKEDLETGHYAGLGGSLQNTWNLYNLLGSINSLSRVLKD